MYLSLSQLSHLLAGWALCLGISLGDSVRVSLPNLYCSKVVEDFIYLASQCLLCDTHRRNLL